MNSLRVRGMAVWVLQAAVITLTVAAIPWAAADDDKDTTKQGPHREVNTRPAKGERYGDTLRAGDQAPDFTLPDQKGKTEVTLSSYRGKKPVVLVFGSYTCPPFRRQVVELEELHQTYKDKAQFLLIYIREAHPDSVLRVLENADEVLRKIGQTNTLDERSRIAQLCTSYLKLTIPTLIDKPDNKVNSAYAGWPNRLAIVGVDGKLAYYSGRGPAGFRPKEIEQWLKANIR